MELASKTKCTGCMACMEKCPRKCISNITDCMGNVYPHINEADCLNCGVCQKVCSELVKIPAVRPFEAYAAWSLDDNERRRSASGGVASVFYRYALDMGYWISGAKYTEDFRVIHTVTDKLPAINDYKQSKYVYSEMGCVYQMVKELLDDGKSVVFISLPCKVAGLLGYLGKKFESLLTVDIVCHGTPPYQNLKEHINCVERGVPAAVKFRQDNDFLFQLLDINGQVLYSKVGRTDPYIAAFLEGLNYRESCYSCEYAKPERISDITICDFWGLGHVKPFEHPYSGSISAVLLNTKAGRTFFQGCQSRLFTEKRPVDEVIRGNAQLNNPSKYPSKRFEFERKYQKCGFDEAVVFCLRDVMEREKKKNMKEQMRKALRKTAGIFVRRYRR